MNLIEQQPVRDLRRWKRIATSVFGEMDVQARAEGFCGMLTVRDWAPLRVVTVSSTPAHVHGGATRRGNWFLLYNRGGLCTVRQAGRMADIDDGEMSLVRADEPYDIRFEQANAMSVIGLPLLDAPAALDDRVALRHGREVSGVVGALLQRLQRVPQHEAAALDPQTLRRVFVDLLLLATPPGGSTRTTSNQRSRLVERLQALVERRLEDPDLDATAVASALGISARYVQMLCASQGTTLGAYLQARRLERAARLLRERNDNIADIALRVGFGDVSHFCRAFRLRFGCTAGRWRAGR